MSDTAENVTATAEPVTESPAVEKVIEKAPGSSELLSLAKREATFRKQEADYKTRLAEANKELEELKYFRSAKDIVRNDPEALLNKLGISYDELTKGILDYYDTKEKNSKPPTAEEVRKQVEEEFRKRESTAQEEASARAIADFSAEINQFVKGNGEAYPHLVQVGASLSGAASADELIFVIVSSYYEETGNLLDLASAASTAEEYFRDEWNKLNGVLSGKAVSKDAPIAAASAPTSAPNVPDDTGQVYIDSDGAVSKNAFKVKDLHTISNNMRPVSSVPYKGRNDNRRDIIERAVATYDSVSKRTK